MAEVACLAEWKAEIGWAEIGSVEDDDFVVVKKLHVHGGYACTSLYKCPCS